MAINWQQQGKATNSGVNGPGTWGAPQPQTLANGATTRSTPMQQWQQSTAGQQPQQSYTPPPQAAQGPAPYMPMDQLKTNLAGQVASKGITQAQADAEINRVQGLWDTYNKGSAANVGAQLAGAQGFDINKAYRDLSAQVASGGINQAQMDAQMAINQKMAFPDFGNTAQGQAASIANTQGMLNNQNMQQQAQYNRVNEYNPYGQSEYRQNPDGSYSRISSLSPEQQALLDSQQRRDLGFSGGMEGLGAQGVANLGQPFDYSKMPKALGMEDLQADRRRIEDTVYDQYAGDINRDYDRQMNMFRQRMADQGIPQGSEMYKQLEGDYMRNQGDALNRARSSAMMTSRGEMESMFDMGDRSRSRGIAEAKDLRYMPLDEVARLGALSGGVQNPQFSGMSQIQAPPIDFGNYASQFMGQDYGLDIYKQKATYDQQMARDQYLWQKAQEEKGGGGGGGRSGGGGGGWDY